MNVFFLKKYRRYTVMYPSQRQFASYFGNYSIKHYLARSCFQLWPKIGDEGDKILRGKKQFFLKAIGLKINLRYLQTLYVHTVTCKIFRYIVG